MINIDLDKMYENYQSNPNKIKKMWEINDIETNNNELLIRKLNSFKKQHGRSQNDTKLNNKLKKQLSFIPIEKWKDNEFIIESTRSNPDLINILFDRFPLFNNIDEQINLEKTILDNINILNVEALYENNVYKYFMNIYISQNRPVDFIEKRQEKFINKYIQPLLKENQSKEELFKELLSLSIEDFLEAIHPQKIKENEIYITVGDGKEDILSLRKQLYLYSENVEYTKDKYQFMVNFINENIFLGNIYEKMNEEIKEKDKLSNNDNEEYNKAAISYNKSKKCYMAQTLGKYLYNDDENFYGESYQYLPKELKKDDKLIRRYLSWIGKIKEIYKSKDNYEEYSKNLNLNNAHYLDINIIPNEFLNSPEKSRMYFYELVLRNDNAPQIYTEKHRKSPDYFGEYVINNSNFINNYFNTKEKWLDLLSYVITIDIEYGKRIWNKYLPKEYKKDKNFIVELFSLEKRNELLHKKYIKLTINNVEESMKEKLENILNDETIDQSAIDKNICIAFLEENYNSLSTYIKPKLGNWFNSSFNDFMQIIYKDLPIEFKSDYDIRKSYIMCNPDLITLIDFPFYQLNIEKDFEIIHRLVKKNIELLNPYKYLNKIKESNRSSEKVYEYFKEVFEKGLRINKDLEVVYIVNNPKNVKTLIEWSINIDLLSLTDIKEVNWNKEEWKAILSNEDNKNFIISEKNMWLSNIPQELVNVHLLREILNKDNFRGFNFEIKNSFWDSANFCFEVLEKTTKYIDLIPNKHWNNKYFVLEVFNAIDNKIIKDHQIISKLPIYIQKFLTTYEVNENYANFYQSYVLNEEVPDKPIVKKKKI